MLNQLSSVSRFLLVCFVFLLIPDCTDKHIQSHSDPTILSRKYFSLFNCGIFTENNYMYRDTGFKASLPINYAVMLLSNRELHVGQCLSEH